MSPARECILALPGLISFWDFQQPAGQQRLAHGPGAYALHEEGGTIERIEGGVFGTYAAAFVTGRWLECPREACPLLNLHGDEAQISILAWLRIEQGISPASAAVAGIWHESEHRRQYGLFLESGPDPSTIHAAGQVACIGAQPTARTSRADRAAQRSAIDPGAWHQVAYTFGRSPDGAARSRVFVDGSLDTTLDYPVSPACGGIANSGSAGADFTVAATQRSGEMGHWFNGALAGLAVCSRALGEEDLAQLHRQVPLPR